MVGGFFRRAANCMVFVVALNLAGCAADSRSESLQSIRDVKEISIAVIDELIRQIPAEHVVSGLQGAPGEMKRTVLPCGGNREYQYPGSYAVEVRDKEAALQAVQGLHKYMREKKLWEERKVTISNRTEVQFLTENGVSVLVTHEQVKSRHLVNIMAYSPCVTVPDGFRPSANRI